MTLAEAIKSSIEARKILPSRREIKQMINRGEWTRLGAIFGFTPKYTLSVTGSPIIDWRCVPETMAAILRQPVEKNIVHHRPGIHPHPTAREFTFNRQGGICGYCRREIPYVKWTIDHIVPVCRGGSKRSENKLGACATCNHAKGCLTAEEFLATDYLNPKSKIHLKDRLREMNSKLNYEKQNR
jgi:5-methylcytosine-specific restriction endonuclease McrA